MATARAQQHCIITGFMGAGKSVVGKLVAWQLARPFFDLDVCISEVVGNDLAAYIGREGEEAFRRLEQAVFVRLLDRAPAVIATGGGTLLEKSMREVAEECGVVICLSATLATIRARIAQGAELEKRPLLHNNLAQLEQHYRQRQSAYAAFAHQLPTDGINATDLATRIATWWNNLGQKM